MPSVYAFEAKSIQSYILAGGKLRDMVGASALIDGLARYPDLGASDLAGLCGADVSGISVLRRAGAALTLVADKPAALEAFRAPFTLLVQAVAPGLPIVDALETDDRLSEALARVRAALGAARNDLPAERPFAPPIAARAQRTGRAAVVSDARFAPGGERIDAATLAKRRAATRDDAGHIAKRALPIGIKDLVWPEDLDPKADSGDAFPFLRGNRTVGVVHADGNGIGRALIALDGAAAALGEPERIALLRDVSRVLSRSAEAAAQAATAEVLVPRAVGAVLPARPIVLGGDDVTMIVRGDLALGWTISYLAAFAERTQALFADLSAAMAKAGRDKAAGLVRDHFGAGFSAGAGIALVKSSQPFDRAYELSSQLADFAKTAAKSRPGTTPSLVAVHRQTTAMFDDYRSALEGELSAVSRDGKGAPVTMIATANPYRVEKAPGGVEAAMFPGAEALAQLTDVLADDGFPAGPLRDAIGRMRSDPYMAERLVKRWREFNGRAAETKERLDGYDRALKALNARSDGGLFAPSDPGWASAVGVAEGALVSPLLDALSLAMARRSDLDDDR